MTRPVSSFLLLLLWIGLRSAAAAPAAFSADGTVVYFSAGRSDDLGTIGELSLETGEVRRRRLTGAGPAQDVLEVATVADGRVLLLTDNALWSWDPRTETTSRLHDCPDGETFRELAVWSETGRVLITSSSPQPDAAGRTGRVRVAESPHGPWRDVWLRRLQRLTAPVFLSADSLLFAAEGDVWMGSLEADVDAEPGPRFILAAHRCAPLADRETHGGTPSQVGVSALAVSKDKVYAHVSRMGGSGWGDIVRLDLPKPIETGLRERYDAYRALLGSVEFLTENPTVAYLCQSPDGTRVVYADGSGPNRQFYLVENNAAPRPVKAP